jgi:hypothetical protein
MPTGDFPDPDGMVWSDVTGWMVPAPKSGFIMPPTEKPTDLAASIICGHDIIQGLSEDDQAFFHSFVREVLRTTFRS